MTYMTLDSILAEWRPRGPLLIASAGSQQISSSELFAELLPPLQRLAGQHGPSPLPGAPAWFDLVLDDPRRRVGIGAAALLWAASADALSASMCEASRAVSAATDWSEVARLTAGRSSSSYIPRRAA